MQISPNTSRGLQAEQTRVRLRGNPNSTHLKASKDEFLSSDADGSTNDQSFWKKAALKTAQVGGAGVGALAGVAHSVGLGYALSCAGAAIGGMSGVLGLATVALGTAAAFAPVDNQYNVMAGAAAAGAAGVLASSNTVLPGLVQFAGSLGTLGAVAAGIALVAKWATAGAKIPLQTRPSFDSDHLTRPAGKL
jgi:small-conductance mechanosensitive channel